MSDTEPERSQTQPEGSSCAVPRPDSTGGAHPDDGGLLTGGCCSGNAGFRALSAPVGRNARRARAIAGLGFLAVAGALSSRRLPGRISLWPTALVPTWFGISHLVAGVTGYEGCPELGAIPSVVLDRPVTTSCAHWRRIDALFDSLVGVSGRVVVRARR